MTFTDRSALALMLALPVFATPGSTLSQTRPDLVIVLDGSGSMLGDVAGRSKMDLARDALAQVLPETAPDMRIGLMAYGHRTRGNCADIETLVAVGPSGASVLAMLDATGRLAPLGTTPLGDAVRQAAGMLRHTEQPATVVLVTDGPDSCGADPCALGRMLEQEGVDFTVHVLALGMTAADQRAVACLAEETGGLVLAASDADDLARALRETILTLGEGEIPPPVDAEDLARALRETILTAGEGDIPPPVDADDLARALRETILVESEDPDPAPPVLPEPPPEETAEPETGETPPGLPLGMFAEYPANPGETAARAFDRIRTDGDLRWQLAGQCRTEPMVFYPDGLIASRELGEASHVTMTHEACAVEGARWSCLRRAGPPEAQGTVEDEYVLDFEAGPEGLFALSLDGEPYVYQPCHGPHGLVFPDETGPDGRPVWQSAMARSTAGAGLVVTRKGVTLPEVAPLPAPLPAPGRGARTSLPPFPRRNLAERRGSYPRPWTGGSARMLDDTEDPQRRYSCGSTCSRVFYPDRALGAGQRRPEAARSANQGGTGPFAL